GFGRPGSERIMMRSADLILFGESDLHTERQLSLAIEERLPIGIIAEHAWHRQILDLSPDVSITHSPSASFVVEQLFDHL
ncbi:MAG: hypothetical protein CUN55_21505, partial [Phototrophicales bacterium]